MNNIYFLNESILFNKNKELSKKCISKNVDKNIDVNIFSTLEKIFTITIRQDIKSFLIENSGGYPIKDTIIVDGDDYEVRAFLSLDYANKYYNIRKPLDFFMKKTNKKIIPIGIDSGDNYYCVNNETGKVYYWSTDENSYFCISNSLNNFMSLFK